MHYVYVPMVLHSQWDESVIIIVAKTIIKLKKDDGPFYYKQKLLKENKHFIFRESIYENAC